MGYPSLFAHVLSMLKLSVHYSLDVAFFAVGRRCCYMHRYRLIEAPGRVELLPHNLLQA